MTKPIDRVRKLVREENKPLTVKGILAAIESRVDNGVREADKRWGLFDLTVKDLDAAFDQIQDEEPEPMTEEEWEELYGDGDDG